MKRPLFIRVKQQADRTYTATCNQLPDCTAQGRTYYEAVANIGEAIQVRSREQLERQREKARKMLELNQQALEGATQ